MSDDRPSPLRRAHRAKRVRNIAGGFDGGAVAVGLVLPLSAFAPTLILEMPDLVVVGMTAIGLFLGGFLARSMTSQRAGCALCHSLLVGVLAVVVIALVLLADDLARSETVVIELAQIAGPEPTMGALSSFIAIAISGLGGLFGSGVERVESGHGRNS